MKKPYRAYQFKNLKHPWQNLEGLWVAEGRVGRITHGRVHYTREDAKMWAKDMNKAFSLGRK